MAKILIIGSGGREHALGWKISQSDEVSTVFYAPGNGGTAENKGVNIPIDVEGQLNSSRLKPVTKLKLSEGQLNSSQYQPFSAEADHGLKPVTKLKLSEEQQNSSQYQPFSAEADHGLKPVTKLKLSNNKENFEKIYDFVIDKKINMVIVGPEGPLTEGIVDHLNTRGFDRVFGPSQKASLLESDKFFSFDLMTKLNIPQAESVKCHTIEEAITAIDQYCGSEGIVIKARGLTGGKGVSICDSKNDALKEIESHSIKYGNEILIARRLFGQEFSVFGISDGAKVLPFEITFQDYKRLMDNDEGPNTGGMGAYGPVQSISREILMNICKNILTPIIQELKKMGIVYKGFIYAGMIMTKNGPKVLEFNVRFGDPECQPAMMMLKSDLYSLLSNALDERFSNIEFHSGAACCVVLASKGYPIHYQKGLPIYGLEDTEIIENVKIFHSGTKKEGETFLSNGGRVLGVTAYSPNNIEEARNIAYKAISKLNIGTDKVVVHPICGGFSYRRDIAQKSAMTI